MDETALPPFWSIDPPPALTTLTAWAIPTPWQQVFQVDLPDNGSESNRQLTISFYWIPVFGAVTCPDAPLSYSVAVTTGITNSTTETQTFTESLTAGASDSLDGLGTNISATISKSVQQSYTQTFTTSTTTTTTLNVAPQQGLMAGQWWQPIQVLQYGSSKAQPPLVLQNAWPFWQFNSFGS